MSRKSKLTKHIAVSFAVALVTATWCASAGPLDPSDLVKALQENGKAELQRRLDGGGNIKDRVDGAGNTYLHVIMNAYIGAHDALDMARFLCVKGANVNAANIDGVTPLHKAFAQCLEWRPGDEPKMLDDWTAVVRFLIEKGADGEARNADGLTPRQMLLVATEDGEGRVLKRTMPKVGYQVWIAVYGEEKFLDLMIAPEIKQALGNDPSAIGRLRQELMKEHGILTKEQRDAKSAEERAENDARAAREREKIAARTADEPLRLKWEREEMARNSILDGQVRFLAIGMGKGVVMEFVWVERLKLWVGKYELTNAQLRRLPLYYSDHDSGDGLNGDWQPAVNVNRIWIDDCLGKWASTTNVVAKLPDGYAPRIPTLREWLAIANTSGGQKYFWGQSDAAPYGNFWGTAPVRGDWYDKTCDVRFSGRNGEGIYGLCGNAAEFARRQEAGSPPDRFWMGLSWEERVDAETCIFRMRADYVPNDPPTERDGTDRGFRVVLAPKGEQARSVPSP